VSAQVPAVQTCPDGHALPHAPQFAGSWSRSAQIASPPAPQSARGAGQTATPVGTQLPVRHRSPDAHASPQAPQFDGSFWRSVQAAEAPEPQMPSGAAHVMAHAPSEQTLPDGQALSQAPQFALSVARRTQSPPQRVDPATQAGIAGGLGCDASDGDGAPVPQPATRIEAAATAPRK